MAGSCLLIDQSRYCQVKVYSLAGQGSSRHMVSMSLIVIKLPKIGRGIFILKL